MERLIKKLFVFWVIPFILVYTSGCQSSSGGGGGGGDTTPDSGTNPDYVVPDAVDAPTTKDQQFSLDLPSSSSLNNESLEIVSFYGSSTTTASSNTLHRTGSVTVTDSTAGQLLIINDDQGTPLFFVYFEPSTYPTTITLSSDSIAKGLIWTNPYVMILSDSQKSSFITQASQASIYSQLVTKIEEVLVGSDPKKLLDPDDHPEIIKTAFAVVKETFQALEGTSTSRNIGETDYHQVLDYSGNSVVFQNPRQTTYGVQVKDTSGNKSYSWVAGRSGLVQAQWGWPPVIPTSPQTSEEFTLADGNYNVTFYKGFNFDVDYWYLPYIPGATEQISDNATIVGWATWYNTFLAADIIIESVIGDSISDHLITLIKRVAAEAGNVSNLLDLAQALNDGDPMGVLGSVNSLLLDNWSTITKVIWGAYGPDSVNFLRASKALLKNIAVVMKGVSWANNHIPFIVDLTPVAPYKVEYCVSSTSGELDETSNCDAQIPPVADLSISPSTIYVGDTVTFDASGSEDDSATSLSFRYDYDSDGTWDAGPTSSSSSTHAYTTAGIYLATVEVTDDQSLTATASQYLKVFAASSGVSSAIVIDRSGSMSGSNFTNAQSAAKTYVGLMGSKDRGAVVSFSSTVSTDQVFTDDGSALTTAIDGLYASGSTAFYDAVYQAITLTASEDSSRRRAVIALTDGYDNSSSYREDVEVSIKRLSEVVTYATTNGIPVHVIGLGSSLDSTSLKSLATDTGGLYLTTTSSSDLQNLYDTIAAIQ